MKLRKVTIIAVVVIAVLALGATFVLAQDVDEPALTPPAAPGLPGPGGFGHRGGPRGMQVGTPLIEIVAEQLDMTVEAVVEELSTGISIAELADSQGVDVQVIVDAFIAEHTELLETAVAEGNLTQEQADLILGRLTDSIDERVNQPWGGQPQGFGPGRRGFPGRGGPRGFGLYDGPNLLEITAGQLDLSIEEVQTALAEGSSIADLAAENGVEVQAIVDAAVAAHQEQLDAAVEAGQLTQEQADDMLAQITTHLETRVNQSGGLGPQGGRRGHGGFGNCNPGGGFGPGRPGRGPQPAPSPQGTGA